MSAFLKKTAILVDGGFYRRRAQALWGEKTAEARATELYDYCIKHLYHKRESRELYRIFYYEGIDFILDPMKSSIRDNLSEHVDGIESKIFSIANEDSSETKEQSTEITEQPEVVSLDVY